MAVQHGPIKLTGQLGGISFYEMGGKHYARRKTAHPVETIRTDPRFIKTYLNALDFGTASKASKLLRKALGPNVKPFSDPRMAGRLTGRFRTIVAADRHHHRGKRQVLQENLSLLKGFELNKHRSFDALGLSPVVSIDRRNRKITIAVDPSLRATDAHLVACVISINFQKGTYISQHSTCSMAEARRSGLQCDLPATTEHDAAIIIAVGVSHDPAGENPRAMVVIEVVAHSEKVSHDVVRQKQHPSKISYKPTRRLAVPGMCATKMKFPEKIVRSPGKFLQTHPLYDRNHTHKKTRTIWNFAGTFPCFDCCAPSAL